MLGTQTYTSFPVACADAGVSGEFVRLQPTDNPKRLLEVLWNRGFSGLLLAPEMLPWHDTDLCALPWDRFAVVKLARVHPELSFNIVRHDAFDYALVALRRTCATAKKRVGVILWRSGSETDNLERLGALLAFREELMPKQLTLEWTYWNGPLDKPDPAVREWLLRKNPDTVLLYHFIMLQTLEQVGLPDDFQPRFCAILYLPGFPWVRHRLAGCHCEGYDHLREALTLLLEMINHGKRGFVDLPIERVIEPVWVSEA